MLPTFFDYIGASDMERIHSATIAWMVSDFCEALSVEKRQDILNVLFGTSKADIVSIQSITEFEHIDIAFISTDKYGNKELWILENKVKAPLGWNQLEKYENEIIIDIENTKLSHDFCQPAHFGLLSLIGALPQDRLGQWHLASYEQLSGCLGAVCNDNLQPHHRHLAVLEEYNSCISHLVIALAEFKKYPEKYPEVFTDGCKPKAAKSLAHYSGIAGYIAKNSLETLFQKAYFTDIVNEISGRVRGAFVGSHVSETRGNADFAFHLGVFGCDSSYEFDLSFQNGAFKLAVCKKGYPNLNPEISEELAKWQKAFEQTQKHFHEYGRLNKPRGRARLSISRNIGRGWYKIGRKQFVDIVISQIDMAVRIAKEIVGNMEF